MRWFSPGLRLVFSPHGVFHRAEGSRCNASSLPIRSLTDQAFGFVSKTTSPNPRSPRFSLPDLLPGVLRQVSHLTCRSMTRFELIFGKALRSVSGFAVSHGMPKCPSALAEDPVPAPSCVSAPLSRSATIFTWVYFRALYSAPLICWSFRQHSLTRSRGFTMSRAGCSVTLWEPLRNTLFNEEK